MTPAAITTFLSDGFTCDESLLRLRTSLEGRKERARPAVLGVARLPVRQPAGAGSVAAWKALLATSTSPAPANFSRRESIFLREVAAAMLTVY